MKRLDRLDALRGIAALLVVWQHTSESFMNIPGVAERGSWLADIAWSVDFGRIGVVCFFLISGYIIPHSFSSAPDALRTFAIRRFFRLYPVYWVSVLLAVVVGAVLAGKDWEMVTVVANLTMIQKILGQQHIQGLYWTLQVELIFYFLCAWIFHHGKMRDIPFITLLGGFLLALFIAVELAFRTVWKESEFSSELRYIPYCLSIMFCGAIIREVLWGEYDLRLKLAFLLTPAAVFGIPAQVLLLYILGVNVVDQPVRFGAAYLIALVVFLIAVFIKWPVPKVLAWVGLVSYSVYLFHPVSMALVHWGQKHILADFTDSWALWMYMSLALLITMALAAVAYHTIERRFISLGRRLSQRESKLPSTAVA